MSFLYLLIMIILIIHDCCSNENDYKLVKAEQRNIIFVGRSRSGKTTLINVMKDKNYSPPLLTILRGNKDASLESFSMSSKIKNLQFNIMDTPGLFERTLSIDDKRTNEIILDVIKKCMDMEITNINHVYFVMSIQQGLNDEDLISFKLFTDLFVGMESKISIIISFAQSLSTNEQYNHYINQFKNVPDLQPLYEKIGGRIFFLGAVQKSAMYDIDALKKTVYDQRAALFEHIIQQNTTYNVKQLKIYQDYISLIGKVKNTLDECCNNSDNKQICNHDDKEKFDSFMRHYTDLVIKKEE